MEATGKLQEEIEAELEIEDPAVQEADAAITGALINKE